MTATTFDICTLCGDELPGTTPGDFAHMCLSCAGRFVADCETTLTDDELRDARALAYATLAGAFYSCENCSSCTQLDAYNRQLVHEGEQFYCPACGATLTFADVVDSVGTLDVDDDDDDSTTTSDICTVCADDVPGTTPGDYAHICASCSTSDDVRVDFWHDRAYDELRDVAVDDEQHRHEHDVTRAHCIVCWALDVLDDEI